MTYLPSFIIRNAAHKLRQGSLIAYPTEAIYGLGCDPLNKVAVLRLLTIKQRPIEKGLILIASDFQQIKPFLNIEDKAILKRMLNTWPGPTTWVAPSQPWVPVWLTGKHESLAVRVTDHPIAARLCSEFGGAIVSTSANISDRPPAKTALQVKKIFADKNVPIIKGKASGLDQATSIFSAISGKQLR